MLSSFEHNIDKLHLPGQSQQPHYSGNALTDRPSPAPPWPGLNQSNMCSGTILRSALTDPLENINGCCNGDKDSDDSPETGSSNSEASSVRKNKASRDPTSHRLIEKRRRDRMNNCLANLSKLIPQTYLSKGRGRVEKTEIIEMAIKYIRQTKAAAENRFSTVPSIKKEVSASTAVVTKDEPKKEEKSNAVNQQMLQKYKQGFYDCTAETLKLIASFDGHIIGHSIHAKLVGHLEVYCLQRCRTLFPANSNDIPQQGVIRKLENEIYQDQPINMSLKSQQALILAKSGSASTNRDQPITTSRSHTTDSLSLCSETLLLLSAANTRHQSPHGPTNLGSCGITPGTSLSEVHADHPSFSVKDFCAVSISNPGGSSGEKSISSGSSTQYPSSPGSFQSTASGLSLTPPRSLTPPLHHNPAGPRIPVFALHSSGLFYVADTVPKHCLTIDLITQHPSNGAVLEDLRRSCHPVSIPVKFFQQQNTPPALDHRIPVRHSNHALDVHSMPAVQSPDPYNRATREWSHHPTTFQYPDLHLHRRTHPNSQFSTSALMLAPDSSTNTDQM